MSISAAWSDVIRSNWASCQLLIDLRTGSYADLSGNARAVTLTNAAPIPQWGTRTKGKSLDLGGITGAAGVLSTPTAAALDLRPSGTIAMFPRSERGFGAGARLAWKRNVGVSCAYDIYDNTGNGALIAYDGGLSIALGTFSWPTTRSIIVTFTTGVPPLGYVNGVRLAVPGFNWSGQADASSVYLPGPGSAVLPGVGWWGWAFFNTRLSGVEITQLHTDFMNSTFSL